MATNLSLIVDTFPLSASATWNPSPLLPMYKGTSWRAMRGQASFLFFFEGTSVAFIGLSPPSTSQTPTVQIDNGTVSSINYDPSPSAYGQWFRSPRLSDGGHTIRVNCVEGTILDFAVVDAGNRTHLTGQTAIVDNDNPSIVYSGHWIRNTSNFQSNIVGKGNPYGNSTHRASTPGDTFTFRFTGTSVSVYGIFSWLRLGFLAATYTVDGTTVPQSYNVTSLERGTDEGDAFNFLYYSLDNLPPGDHTLVVNVTVANNQTLALDYITYIPSFETLSSIPQANNTTPTSSGAFGSSSTSSLPSISGTSLLSQIHPFPTAAVVGGVIGALAFGVMVGAWTFLRRRKTKQTEKISRYLYQDDANSRYIPNPTGKRRRISHVRPQGPEKFGRSNHATGSRLQPSLYPPPNIDNLPPGFASDPPPYDELSIAR